MILPSGYLNIDLEEFDWTFKDRATDIGPTLPKNMVIIKISLLILFRFGVIPVESPTVPKAEKPSKRH